MNKIYLLPEDELGDAMYQRIYLLMRKNRPTWQSTGAMLGLTGGMLAIFLGLLIWPVSHFLSGGFNQYLNILETSCFISPLPLWALGAYCLDLLEEMPPALPLPKGRGAPASSKGCCFARASLQEIDASGLKKPVHGTSCATRIRSC